MDQPTWVERLRSARRARGDARDETPEDARGCELAGCVSGRSKVRFPVILTLRRVRGCFRSWARYKWNGRGTQAIDIHECMYIDLFVLYIHIYMLYIDMYVHIYIYIYIYIFSACVCVLVYAYDWHQNESIDFYIFSDIHAY